MKVFISQPMNGLTDKEIKEKRDLIKSKTIQYFNEIAVEFIDSNFQTHQIYEQVTSFYIPVGMLGRSIQRMSEAIFVIFADGYENARGCKIEKMVCDEYGIDYILEKDLIKSKGY